MESYYCALNEKSKNPDRFQLLFGDTYIGKNPTAEQGKYIVLFWDFSIDTAGDVLDMRKLLYDEINQSIRDCQQKYGTLLNSTSPIDSDNAMVTFKEFAHSVRRSGYPLYLIIDEYDRFANKILFESPDAYAKMIAGISGDPKSSVIRSVLETVKSVSTKVNMRAFITGISPMAMADASGYSVCENITHQLEFASIVGFEESDLKRGLNEIFTSDSKATEKHLAIMKEWYNGYRMHPHGPLLYNPTLCLHYLKNLGRGSVPKMMEPVDKSIAKSQFNLVDENTMISENVFELIAKNPASNDLVSSLFVGKELEIKTLPGKFALRNLLTGIHAISRDYLLTFMFHHGIVTFTDSEKMVIPNRLSKDQFLTRIQQRLGESVIRDIQTFLNSCDDILLEDIIYDITRNIHSSSADVGNYNESSMRNAINAAFRTGCSRRIESEKIIPISQKQPDIVIYNQENNGIEFIFELGIVGIGALDLKHLSECASLTDELKNSVAGLTSPKNLRANHWSVEEKSIVEGAIYKLSIDDLLGLKYKPYSKNYYRTIQNLLSEKVEQVWQYGNSDQLIDEEQRKNLKCRAVVGVGMQRVIIEPVSASLPLHQSKL